MTATTLNGVLLTGNHAARPAATAVAKGTVYACSTHTLLYQSDGATWSTWFTPGTTSTTVATDTIWDAAGDLAVGSGADTAARLAKGAAGGALSIINGAVAWNSGTSFPASKLTGDRYWRTDLGLLGYWDGTRWLSDHLFTADAVGADTGATWPLTNNQNFGRTTLMHSDFECYLVNLYGVPYVATTNSGSHYWTVTVTGGVTSTAYGTYNTSANAANTHVGMKTALNTAAGSTERVLNFSAAKTAGTPGNIYAPSKVTYRLILT